MFSPTQWSWNLSQKAFIYDKILYLWGNSVTVTTTALLRIVVAKCIKLCGIPELLILVQSLFTKLTKLTLYFCIFFICQLLTVFVFNPRPRNARITLLTKVYYFLKLVFPVLIISDNRTSITFNSFLNYKQLKAWPTFQWVWLS